MGGSKKSSLVDQKYSMRVHLMKVTSFETNKFEIDLAHIICPKFFAFRIVAMHW